MTKDPIAEEIQEEKEILLRFGMNLKKVRTLLGMKQCELAEKAGLTRASVCMIEAGQREPSLSTIVKILNVIPVKLEKLIYD